MSTAEVTNLDDAFVRRFLRPWNEHDVDGAMLLMTEDCLWEVPRGVEPHGTLIEGAKAVRNAIAAVFTAMPDVRYEVVRSSFGPGLAVLELLVTGTRAGGERMKLHACDVMTVRDGKVSAKRSYLKVVNSGA